MMTCHSDAQTFEARALYWEHRAMQLEAALKDASKVIEGYEKVKKMADALANEIKVANAYIEEMKRKNSELILPDGTVYRFTTDLAEDGDLIVYDCDLEDGYIKKGKAYKVKEKDGLLIAICEEETECVVYTGCSPAPFVYKKDDLVR